jgi:hypothetical protein
LGLPLNVKVGHRKHGFWLMRGAQPATSAGARLFCRKPDSGILHHPAKGGEEINLELGKLIRSLRSNKFCRNISELTL